MNTQSLKATYDIWSKTYDDTPDSLILAEEIVVRSLLRTLEFHDVLDAATGTGRYAVYLAEQGKRVAAIDCNENMLAQARKKANRRQLSIEFRLEDVSDLSFEDASFDLVTCTLALAHVKDLDKPCREFVRVLRPGGHLIISDLYPAIQARWGPDRKQKLVEGEEPLFFPAYHSQVDDYLCAVKSANVKVLATIDVPVELKMGITHTFLVVWARNSAGSNR